MDYKLMIPPMRIGRYEDMKKKDAKKHFDWYISEVPKRIEQLRLLLVNFESESSVILDFTPQSLIELWNWYINNVEILDKTEIELENEKSERGIYITKNILKNKISIEWLAIAVDIGIYFAECMIKNCNNLKWDVIYKPKSLMCVNKPVVVGFKSNIQMDSANLMLVQTRKILKGQYNNKAMFDLFNNWQSQ